MAMEEFKQKDPAFLFYTKDFFSGVAGMTMEERGQYITLLCLQHQQGHLSERLICLTLNISAFDSVPYVKEKFRLDENGLYYNERLDIEIAKRDAYCKSKSENASRGWEKRRK